MILYVLVHVLVLAALFFLLRNSQPLQDWALFCCGHQYSNTLQPLHITHYTPYSLQHHIIPHCVIDDHPSIDRTFNTATNSNLKLCSEYRQYEYGNIHPSIHPSIHTRSKTTTTTTNSSFLLLKTNQYQYQYQYQYHHHGCFGHGRRSRSVFVFERTPSL
jgi:hypothetical protein